MIYGIPNVLKMSETSAGMKTRRVSSASSAVVELSRSKSFILLQAERGGWEIHLRQLHSTVCFYFSIHSAKLLKFLGITKHFVEKSALITNKLQ